MTGIKIYDPYTDSFVEHDSDAFTTLVAQSVIDERNRCLDVLDKIEAEIQKLRGCSCYCSDGIIDDVEDIIDKYRKETE